MHSGSHNDRGGIKGLDRSIGLYRDLIVSDISLNGIYGSTGVYFDMRVVVNVLRSSLDKLIRRKLAAIIPDAPYFVEKTPKLGFPLYDRDIKALISQTQGSGHTRYSTANYQGVCFNRKSNLFSFLKEPSLGHTHLHQILSLFRSYLMVIHVNPGNLFPDTHKFEQVRV